MRALELAMVAGYRLDLECLHVLGLGEKPVAEPLGK